MMRQRKISNNFFLLENILKVKKNSIVLHFVLLILKKLYHPCLIKTGQMILKLECVTGSLA